MDAASGACGSATAQNLLYEPKPAAQQDSRVTEAALGTKATILVVDDEALIRWSLCEHLRQEGFHPIEAEDGAAALELVGESVPDLVLTDLKMPRMDGMSLLRELRQRDLDVPVVVMTAHGGVESAVEATQLGAHDYVSKPFDLRQISISVARALEAHRLQHQVQYLKGRTTPAYGQIIGDSPAMHRLFHTLRRLEEIDAPTVLLAGESGTGKDLIAHAIHELGPRRRGPLMEVDCASLPEPLIESTLFGHEKGAFTDARATKPGLFEVARGGTIFLDEIGEMSLATQAKLLRALENRKFKRVGGLTDINLDAGVIAASARDLALEVRAGRFREELFFRLGVIRLTVPPLRERREDIPNLVDLFVQRFNREYRRNVVQVSDHAMRLLVHHRWPGNVRELRNVVERIVILEADDIIQAEHLPAEIRYGADTAAAGSFSLPEGGIDLAALEANLLQQALDRTKGNQAAAARLLGLTRYQLRYRLGKQRR